MADISDDMLDELERLSRMGTPPPWRSMIEGARSPIRRRERRVIWSSGCLFVASALFGACGSTNLSSDSQVGLRATASTVTSVTAPSTALTTHSSNPPTTIINDPNPYQPSYDTIAALADDSIFIVIATVEPETSINTYPLNVQQSLGTASVKTTIGISGAEFNAANLAVGGTYVFFYGSDPVDNENCIVGGVRGVFSYDPSTKLVTRLDQIGPSRVPETQTLAQLENELQAAEVLVASKPIANIPPVCESSATGLSQRHREMSSLFSKRS
jgi:hypothetical protein